MSELGKLAVILLSYNRPTLVQRAIRSILNQTCQDYKLYIIDNNSNENVQKILQWYAANFSEKIVYHVMKTKQEDRMKKCWISIMVNWGIQNSKEQYLCMITDDMWYHNRRIEFILEYLKNNPSKVVYGTQITMDKDFNIIRTRPAKDILPKFRIGIAGEQVVFDRSVIDEIGLWNESASVNTCMDREFLGRIPYDKIPIENAINYELEHYKRWTKLMKKGGQAKSELVDGGLME